jgi:hypothetical protein
MSTLDDLRDKRNPTQLDLAVMYYGDEQGTEYEIKEGEKAAAELAALRAEIAELHEVKDGFEKLLSVSRQALAGVDFQNRKVVGFAGLVVLENAVLFYEQAIIAEGAS